MRKPKPQCTTCDNHAGGGLAYCYVCLGRIFDNAPPWQPRKRDDSHLLSREAYKVRPSQSPQ